MQRVLIIIPLLISLNYGQNIPFKVGEHLTYTLQFNVIKMGRGYLSVESIDTVSGLQSYHVKFQAKTNKFADNIYRVRDKIDIWLNTSDLTTVKLVKQLSEGNYHKNYYTSIDYNNSIAITNNDTLKITGALRDPYSLLYYFRTIPLEIGQILDFTTFDNKKLTDFQVIVGGKETVETPAGTFPCIIIKPFRDGKTLLKNDGDMKIWFSDDELRLPVQIQIKLKFGSMLLQLRTINL
ncbi:DUF3108 domain-containing protein [bacterium]|nr:DUF3108 domain-containing protein [bacterium]